MESRPLGRTGLVTPVVAFGGIPVNRVSEAQGIATVRRCRELGYRLYDTSRTYGDSERRVGLGLGEARGQVVLSTKLGPWKVENEADADRFLQESLAALGVDRVDIYMLKNLDHAENLRRALELALPAAQRAQRQGLIGHIGMTSHVPEFARQALLSGEFGVALLPYSIANRGHEPVLELCRERGIGVLVMKPLAGGALVEPEREQGSIRDALRFCLDHPAVSAVVVGVGSEHEAEVAWEAGEQASPLAPGERERLIAAAESMGTDYCRGCDYCQPCTAGIQIGTILQLADRVRRFGTDVALRDASRDHYRGLEVDGGDCEDCRQCLDRCPFGVAIPERLAQAHELLGG